MRALAHINPDNVVFFDIETIAATPTLEPKTSQYLAWAYKMRHSKEAPPVEEYEKEYLNTAALYPEFAKIVCITIGKIVGDQLKLKSYYNHDEDVLLNEFATTMDNVVAANKSTTLCGFAIKGFDMPFIMRRCLANRIPVPSIFDTSGLKPWDLTAIDLKELWQGSSWNSANLISVAHSLDLVSPKDDIEGAQTTETYYQDPEQGLKRIAVYCEKDVITTANIFQRLRFQPLVQPVTEDIKVLPVGPLQRTFNTGKLTEEDSAVIEQRTSKLRTKVDKEAAAELTKIATTTNA